MSEFPALQICAILSQRAEILPPKKRILLHWFRCNLCYFKEGHLNAFKKNCLYKVISVMPMHKRCFPSMKSKSRAAESFTEPVTETMEQGDFAGAQWRFPKSYACQSKFQLINKQDLHSENANLSEDSKNLIPVLIGHNLLGPVVTPHMMKHHTFLETLFL